ncbi:MAG: SHOCT domain-containing protein [Methylophaga sp.]|nr:SHOCT domain-containing protein [Methylophaga sp.]
MQDPIYEIEDVNSLGWLKVYEDKVVLTKKDLFFGTKTENTILFSSISNVQISEPGKILKLGTITFSLYGESNKDTLDIFCYRIKDYEQIFEIKNFITLSKGAVRKDNNFVKISIADELQKLVSLKDQGILTVEEFQSAKEKLIS